LTPQERTVLSWPIPQPIAGLERPMKRLGAVLAALSALVPVPARTAELTRIASSFEKDHPFGMLLEVGYQRTQERARIVREAHQQGAVVDMPELNYLEIDQRLVIDARIGIWRDLELHYSVPVVLSQNRTWRYAAGTDNSNSTIFNNCLQANGDLVDPACPTTGVGSQALFTPNSDTYRSGLGDMTFGLAYAIFNQARDDTKPMWIVGLDYTAPTAALRDPTVPTDSKSRGAIGDKLHKYKFYTTLSRRMGAAEPYVQLQYTLPVRGPGWYSNCDHPDPRNMARPQNCADPAWGRSETGINGPHVAGLLFGTELQLSEDAREHRYFSIDLRGLVTYFSPGRYYNELTDVLGKLLYTQDYLQVGGGLGINAQPAAAITVRGLASLAYNTDHTLTSEMIGKDLDGDRTVDITANPREINPTYDFRTDVVSRRFRAVESFVFRAEISARLNF